MSVLACSDEFSETIEKVKYQKCFMPTLYPANLYDKRPTKGRILLSDTNFHQLKIGSKVNLEFDIIGKYVAKMMQK